MLIAIETSGRGAGLALATADGLVGELELPPTTSTAAGLIPAIEQLVTAHGARPADLRAIAVTIGPGSFTGLRVGVTTAKTLAYATGAALIGVDTLQVIAEQCPPDIAQVWTLLDAQRGELYAARWTRLPAGWQLDVPAEILRAVTLAERLTPDDWLSGPGCALLPEGFRAAQIVDPSHGAPRAATVARIGLERFAAGHVEDPWRLAPRYLRRAAAEEKADARSAPPGR